MVNKKHMNTQKIEGLWTHLHWLTVLAEQGTYTAAAARLGVSKAAMSQRISELERAAGVARGLIRVAAPVAFVRQQLVPKMSAFLRANPEVRVQLEVSDRVSSIAT